MGLNPETRTFYTPPPLVAHVDRYARYAIASSGPYDRLKAIHDGHDRGVAEALQKLHVLDQRLPHGFQDDKLLVFDMNKDQRDRVRQTLEILIAPRTNEFMLGLVKEGGVRVTDDQLHQLFPSSRPEYRASTAIETERIRRSAQHMGFPLPKGLEAFKPPEDDNPGLVVVEELQHIIAERNDEVKKAGPVGLGNDIVVAWIKGGSMPHFARILFGKVFHYPSLTLHHVADVLQLTSNLKNVTLDAARQFATFFFSEILGDSEPNRRYNPYGKPLSQLRADIVRYRSADHPWLSDYAGAFTGKLDEYDGLLVPELKEANALVSAVRSNNLSSYCSDLDIGMSLPPSEVFKAASRIALKLQERGFTIRTNSRHADNDPHFLLYEIFIKRADGTEQSIEFDINPNHLVASTSTARVDNTSMAVDIAYEMSAYQSMRLVMTGEELYFYDPFNIVINRGQRIGVSPLFGYQGPPQKVVAPFYLSGYHSLSANAELSPWDRDFMRSITAYATDVLSYSAPQDASDVIPNANRYLFYALHNAQKALRAEQAVGLYDAKEMHPGSIFDRLIALWDEIGMFDLINLICRRGKIAQETLAELERVFPHQIKVNFPAPDEASCDRYAQRSIAAARTSDRPYNPIANPEKIGEYMRDFIEA